jgi:hypothetical protein
MIDAIQNILVPPGQPPVDTERAIHIATNGAPIAGHYYCNFDDVEKCKAYINHPSIKMALSQVQAKFKRRREGFTRSHSHDSYGCSSLGCSSHQLPL